MRFEKGSKVEVFNKNEVPSGSWRCAEIINGNGHYYTVSYNSVMDTENEADVERVSRKDIRPRPLFTSHQKWFPGDVVEVFDIFSWKMATVLRVLNRMFCLVRLVGSTREITVCKFDIRIRQSWTDDKWVVIGQGSGYCIDDNPDKNIVLKYSQRSMPRQRNARANVNVKNDRHPYNTMLGSKLLSIKTRKRGAPHECSQIDAYAGPAKKIRTIKKRGSCYEAGVHKFSIPEQLGDFAYPEDRISECYDMEVERGKLNSGPVALDIKPADEGSFTCSVGSCSINNSNSCKFPSRFAAPLDESDYCLSDAESVFPFSNGEGNHLLPKENELEIEVHRLELHAYRSTMGALHASGPLSWEQEALITNLRLLLHISNDEHLTEIKNLVTSRSSSPLS